VTDVVAGNMNMMFNSIAPIVGHIKAERVRVLGIASAKRSPQLPDVPTISEAGVPGFEAVNWFGLFAPAKTPKPIIARLNAAVVKVLHTEDMRAQYAKLGADVVGSSPQEFASYVRRDIAKYADIVKRSGARLD
jgi:tripartite-type tricarboxylate transporter receptor subunit TctC